MSVGKKSFNLNSLPFHLWMPPDFKWLNFTYKVNSNGEKSKFHHMKVFPWPPHKYINFKQWYTAPVYFTSDPRPSMFLFILIQYPWSNCSANLQAHLESLSLLRQDYATHRDVNQCTTSVIGPIICGRTKCSWCYYIKIIFKVEIS